MLAYIVVTIFFITLVLAPFMFLVHNRKYEIRPKYFVLYHPKCEISTRVHEDYKSSSDVAFINVAEVPLSSMTLANGKANSEHFESGRRVRMGSASAVAGAEHVLSLIRLFAFGGQIPLTVPVRSKKIYRDLGVLGYPNLYLGIPRS